MSRVIRPFSTTQPSTMHVQSLVIRLDGITAGDYLTWARDPEPGALDDGLRSVAITAAPVGETVNIELVWDREPPALRSALVAAGFPLIPEVVETQQIDKTARAMSPNTYRLLMNNRRAEQRRRTKRQHPHKMNWTMGVQRA